MKQYLLFILVLLGYCPLFATDYYFSSSSVSATEDGTITNPYKTLSAFSALTLAANDRVLFKSGDVFRGQITVNQSGTSGNPIVFTSYGSGAKPIISGAEKVTSWSLVSSRYQATVASTVKNFFINDLETQPVTQVAQN